MRNLYKVFYDYSTCRECLYEPTLDFDHHYNRKKDADRYSSTLFHKRCLSKGSVQAKMQVCLLSHIWDQSSSLKLSCYTVFRFSRIEGKSCA